MICGSVFKEDPLNIDKATFKEHIRLRLKRRYGKELAEATLHDIYDAVAAASMEYILDNWMATRKAFDAHPGRQMFYLSAEFLMGRALTNNLINLGILDMVKEVLAEIGHDINEIEDQEPDAGLGNGGLGRLAACFLDSLATMNLPGHGYGIRYRYGMFEQKIEHCRQIEKPDNWLEHRDPWEIKRSDLAVDVKIGGEVAIIVDEQGRERFTVKNAEIIRAIPHDMPIVGYDTKTVNTLRLWEAYSPDGFNLQLFNDMQYIRAVEKANQAEDLSRVLYPNDSGPSGKALRLKQQYFFVKNTDMLDAAIEKAKLFKESLPKDAGKVWLVIDDTIRWRNMEILHWVETKGKWPAREQFGIVTQQMLGKITLWQNDFNVLLIHKMEKSFETGEPIAKIYPGNADYLSDCNLEIKNIQKNNNMHQAIIIHSNGHCYECSADYVKEILDPDPMTVLSMLKIPRELW